MIKPVSICLALMAISAGAPGQAQPDGDVERGRQLATRYCEECHDITASGPAKVHPPSFSRIAGFRPTEQIRARIWFAPYHASMPVFAEILFPNDVEDLVAYIQSLE